MLTKRLVGKILVNHLSAVQSKGFKIHLPLGRPDIIAEFYDEWGVDEILLIDRTATRRGTTIDCSLIEQVVAVSRSPLAVAGGISSVASAVSLVRAGADRVAINASFLDSFALIDGLVNELGQQAVIAAVDFVRVGEKFYVFDYRKGAATDHQVKDWCVELKQRGVGELFVHSVDRDGSRSGYECELYRQLRPLVDIPLIASGGFGIASHVNEVLDTEVDAVAMGNALNYSEHAISTVKACLGRYDIRQAGVPGYSKDIIGDDGRLKKRADSALEAMRFVKRERQWI